MAARFLILCSLLIVELGGGIASLIGVASMYPYRMDEGGIAACVGIVVGTLTIWLLTIAFFIRNAPKVKIARMMNDARTEAAKIVADATDKALALCSLDAGQCKQCGNPRTGKFCPKCGSAGESKSV